MVDRHQKLISHSSGGWKSEIRVLAWLDENHLPGLRPLIVSSHGRRVKAALWVSFIRALIPLMRSPLLWLKVKVKLLSHVQLSVTAGLPHSRPPSISTSQSSVKTIPRKKKCKRQNDCLRRAYKQLRKKRSKRQRRKGKIYPSECRVSKNSKGEKRKPS